MKIIGIVHSPFKEKFSTPRQPGLTSLESIIELTSPYNREEALKGLEAFSHLWVLFLFHENKETPSDKLVVRPPRLGGNIKQGVFATRSPYRPNNIGMSLVKIKSIEKDKITIIGADILDGTPVIDLKPYLKEIESVPDAVSGWTDDQSLTTKKLDVLFECEVEVHLKNKIVEVLALDPRPRFHEDGYKKYGSRLDDVDVHWEVRDNVVHVTAIKKIT